MKMKTFNDETISAVASVMAQSFMEDPMNRAVLDGLDKAGKH